MEHVNDDMDELFRQAGELYPLRTSESDWDGMLGKLREEISGEKGIPYAVPVRDGSTRRRWLLLMLIPAFIFSLVYFTGSKVNGPVTRKGVNLSGEVDKKVPAKSDVSSSVVKKPAVTPPAINSEQNSDELPDRSSVQKMSSGKNANDNSLLSGKSNQESILKQSDKIQTKDLTGPESIHEPVEKPLFLSVEGLSENPSVYGMPFVPLAKKEITLTPKAPDVAKNKTKNPSSSKGIFVTLVGGPDWSTVKLQSTEQAGYSLGLLVGYRFSKRFSIESGLLWDKKNYYTDGQYFDKSKTSIPDTVNIKNLDGYCNMFEIPINLRYNFANRNNHSFFVVAGLSSYLMKKEYYNFNAEKTYMVGGLPIVSAYSGNKTYKNSTNNIFSILQISGGYEYSIGKNTNIRIEPYVKIPLRGIGIGNMPISSMGLYFGISHSFH